MTRSWEITATSRYMLKLRRGFSFELERASQNPDVVEEQTGLRPPHQ